MGDVTMPTGDGVVICGLVGDDRLRLSGLAAECTPWPAGCFSPGVSSCLPV